MIYSEVGLASGQLTTYNQAPVLQSLPSLETGERLFKP